MSCIRGRYDRKSYEKTLSQAELAYKIPEIDQ